MEMKTYLRSPIMMFLCITLIFMALLTVRPSVTYACSCVVPEEPLVALEKSTAVFTGKVVDMKEPKGLIISSADPVTVTFEVESSWKGTLGNKVKLNTALSSASCGFEFVDGESYLVYAYASDKGDSGELAASLCSRTVLLSSAGDDLKALGPGASPEPPTESPGTVLGDSGSANNVYVWVSAAVIVLLAIVIAVLYRHKRK